MIFTMCPRFFRGSARLHRNAGGRLGSGQWFQLRSALGAGSLVDVAGAVPLSLGIVADELLGVLLVSLLDDDGVLDIDGVVAPGACDESAGAAVGFCICSDCGAPCAVLLVSEVCAYANPIAPTMVADATAVVRILEARMRYSFVVREA
jgi:hypothetical protein